MAGLADNCNYIQYKACRKVISTPLILASQLGQHRSAQRENRFGYPSRMRNFLLVFLFLALSAQAETITGRVIGVTDGDTLKVLDAQRVTHKIRVVGIDAPESKQDFGQRSKANLSALAFNQQATLECSKTDKYRRKVCVVMVDGLDVGLEQIKAGMAWWYRKYAKEQNLHQRVSYEAAEYNARKNRIGLWVVKNPVAPWEWRRHKPSLEINHSSGDSELSRFGRKLE